MRVLAIAFVYNEIDFIETAVNYYKQQGCDIFVIDNYSTDGTYEWLISNNIQCSRVDTAGAFDLKALQNSLIERLHTVKPDWFVWFAPDLFHVFPKTIAETVAEAEQQGRNQIQSICYSVKYTGGGYKLPLQDYYFFGFENKNTLLISKYDEKLRMSGDRIHIPLAYPMETGVVFEYGGSKTKEIQEEKLSRRQKAWQNGMKKSHGTHYIEGKKRDWKYQPEELTDIRKHELFETFKTRIKKCSNH